MPKDVKQEELEQLSAEAQDVMKFLVSAIRIIKLYPPNNPIYAQSLRKAFETLTRFLETSSEYRMGVQKAGFSFGQAAIGKDAQVNKSIAQDLFMKGIREIIFTTELTEQELLELFQTLALSPEELAMKNGIATVLWERGVSHIKVTEAGLDDVITADADDWDVQKAETEEEKEAKAKKRAAFAGKTLVLGDVRTDPEGFAATMLAFAIKTAGPNETVEDRLYTLYQQASIKISKDHAAESDELFEGLAKSVLALDAPHRNALIAGKLFGDLDMDIAKEIVDDVELPTDVHEVQSGRYNDAWSVQQVASLLKRSTAKKVAPAAPPPNPADLQVQPLGGDLTKLLASIESDSPEQQEALRVVSESGMEWDVIEAAVRTLIAVMPLVRSPIRADAPEKERMLFSGIIHQLEDILGFLLQSNRYEMATKILRALHAPTDPVFKARIADALKKTVTKTIVKGAIFDMRKHPKGSPEYTAAYEYLANLEQKVTVVLLEILSEEKDRNVRIFMLDLLKDISKDQYSILGEHITDSRWYVVRNIVNILAESKGDQALILLRRAADHENVVIRQEVIRALLSIGGKKACTILIKFLHDPDETVQLLAVRSLPEMQGVGPEEARALIEFLENRPLGKKGQELTIAAIKSLGKVGGGDAAVFLHQFTRIYWWRSRSLQEERREAALRSIEEITRRQGDVGRTQR